MVKIKKSKELSDDFCFWSLKQEKEYKLKDAIVRDLAGIKVYSDSDNNPLMIKK